MARRLLPYVVALPAALALLLDAFGAAPGWWHLIADLVVVLLVLLAARSLVAGVGPPRAALAGVVGVAAVVVALVATAGLWFTAIAWGLIVLAAALAGRLDGRADQALLAGVTAVAVLPPLVAVPDEGPLLAMAMATAVTVAISIGLLVRSHRIGAEQLRRTAVAEERAGMARELHDLVAHEVTGIVVLAQAATMATDEPQTAEVLRRIERSGQTALGQVRSMVRTLRADAGELELRPTGSGVAGLRSLTTDFAAQSTARVVTDLPDELTVEPAVDATVQRVVAEALTNIRRHAAGARQVEVSVRHTGGQVRIRVRNDGTGTGGLGDGSGFGLVGLRERLALVGGSVHAGPDGDDGWLLTAQVPA
ncbi:hypothetical protein G9U51_14975 [Calidifontibacter sp. DB0510]|uniref:histidine kinase n=1 Tax=Metallococcus carri TaxID=1656884 RepID=A0A967B7M5_9MICO|nr:histidine kinase [Metallococcus carri]NHN57072.1 hypothetical protein [Metallococcus carri]NOP39059.1 hypothetical protein [Calidifontibacter sp. DB2511S]